MKCLKWNKRFFIFKCINCNFFYFTFFHAFLNKKLQNNNFFFFWKLFLNEIFYEKLWNKKMLSMNSNQNRKMCIMMKIDLNGMYDVLRRFISQNDSILFRHDKPAEWSQFLMNVCLIFLLNHSTKNFHLKSCDKKLRQENSNLNWKINFARNLQFTEIFYFISNWFLILKRRLLKIYKISFKKSNFNIVIKNYVG
jgi:hypothetical protein